MVLSKIINTDHTERKMSTARDTDLKLLVFGFVEFWMKV